MAITGSGQVSLGDIQTEYGGSNPIQLSEYYGDGNAPASGEIQLAGDFYGTSAPVYKKAIFAFGAYSPTYFVSTSNKVNISGVVASDTSGVGWARQAPAGAAYGGDKAVIFAGAYSPSYFVNISNKVSNSGAVASNTSAVSGTTWARQAPAGVGYGTDKAVFAFGAYSSSYFVNVSNKVSNSGVVASNTSAVSGTTWARQGPAGTAYGTDKGVFAFGAYSPTYFVNVSNKVSNSGVVASNTSGVGSARQGPGAAGYSTDKAIFAFGAYSTSYFVNTSNKVSNSGAVASDTSGVGSARQWPAAASYG